jgi:hypothetical protein
MLETLKKKAEEFAIHEASQKATDEMMKVIKPYVVGEMKKMEGEFERMAKYINSVENKVDVLTKRVSEIEKERNKQKGEL